MRVALVLIVAGGVAGAARPARAGDASDAIDAMNVGAAVGAGAQGATTYGALELSLDAQWHGVRLGLGARGVWLDGQFRARDWDAPSDAITVIRLLELHSPGGALALAAGALAPAQLAHVADGHRAALDDHPRTGVRTSAVTRGFALALEIDDVLDPTLAGGAATVQVAARWAVRAAAAVDPSAAGGTHGATELALARTWRRDGARDEAGAGLVYEPGFGASALVFADAERARGDTRLVLRTDLRAGTGSVGRAFGPLYRLERADLWQHAEAGVGVGGSASVAFATGWITASVRARPGHGVLGSVSAGAPMGRWLQVGAWAAASADHAAGAGELRVAWARRLSSALQIARMYDTDAMQPAARWSVTAWFGVFGDGA